MAKGGEKGRKKMEGGEGEDAHPELVSGFVKRRSDVYIKQITKRGTERLEPELLASPR